MPETITLYRPVGPKELEKIEATGMKRFPPRLPEQPIFYPVLTEEYATKIARDWNVQKSGSGYVTKFHVRKRVADKYEPQEAGAKHLKELWVPAEDLHAFNDAIVGEIEVIATFSG